MNKGLGRIAAPDPRDKNYRIARPSAEAAAVESRYWITRGKAYDQGNTSQCVAYAGNRWLSTNPQVNAPLNAPNLYRECQLVDEWPGENYDGTSVRALFKVLQKMGYCTEYNWTWSAAGVIDWVAVHGPMVVGTDWTWDMFFPGLDGFVRPTGSIIGGHAYTVIGMSRSRGALRCMNSWGPEWGQKGRFWLKFEDFDHLMRNGGEACTAKEKRL